jgi:hypothetical protein
MKQHEARCHHRLKWLASEYRVYRDLEEDVADLREGEKTESERASILNSKKMRVSPVIWLHHYTLSAVMKEKHLLLI